MGSAIWTMLEEGKRGMEIAAGIDPTADGSDPRILKGFADYQGEADVIIDFSHHACTASLMDFAEKKGAPVCRCNDGADRTGARAHSCGIRKNTDLSVGEYVARRGADRRFCQTRGGASAGYGY